jgi:DNA-binding NarL/FixJ family response regulator
MSIRLVLANDLPIVLDGLESLFRKEPDIEVLARCGSSEETLQAVRKFQPDVLMLGMNKPGPNGLAILSELKEEEISTRVILLAVDLDEDDLLEAVRLDVSGVLTKGMPSQLFVQCVRKVHAGERWLEMRSFSRALEALLRHEASAREVSRILTPREIEIVGMVFDERALLALST